MTGRVVSAASGASADDLGPASYRGPVPKPAAQGGIGKPKRKKSLSAEFIDAKAEKRARKNLTGCRLCPNSQGFRIEPHHVVRRGSPHFGTWDGRNILSLCLACHSAYHSGDEAIRKAIRLELTRAEVDYAEDFAFQGFLDKFYWPLPKDAHGQTTVGCELLAALPKEAA